MMREVLIVGCFVSKTLHLYLDEVDGKHLTYRSLFT